LHASDITASRRPPPALTAAFTDGAAPCRYEEARVALHACLVSVPLCVLLGITCRASLHWPDRWADLPSRIREHYSLRQEQNVLYAALALAVINSLEKLVRLSKVGGGALCWC
jgi:hypothetical protein